MGNISRECTQQEVRATGSTSKIWENPITPSLTSKEHGGIRKNVVRTPVLETLGNVRVKMIKTKRNREHLCGTSFVQVVQGTPVICAGPRFPTPSPPPPHPSPPLRYAVDSTHEDHINIARGGSDRHFSLCFPGTVQECQLWSLISTPVVPPQNAIPACGTRTRGLNAAQCTVDSQGVTFAIRSKQVSSFECFYGRYARLLDEALNLHCLSMTNAWAFVYSPTEPLD